jgi:hypothetical protein
MIKSISGRTTAGQIKKYGSLAMINSITEIEVE